jgi:hypothetical protein
VAKERVLLHAIRAAFRSAELSRMAGDMRGFEIYKAIEIAIIAGAALASSR